MLDIATVRGGVDLLNSEQRADNGRLLDLDIVALGTLVEAICFFDSVLVPDLGHQRGAAITASAGEAIQYAAVSESERRALLAKAAKWLPDHFRLTELVALLGATSTTADHSKGSDDFLLLESVGVRNRYESAIVDAVWSDGSAGHPDRLRSPQEPRRDSPTYINLATVLGTHGKPHSAWHVRPEMEAFVANLAWALTRARCYLAWAHKQDVTYMPHPLRARMAGFAAMTSARPDSPRPQDGAVRHYLDRIALVHEEGLQAAADFVDVQMLKFPFPSVLPYVIRRAGAKQNILEAAYDLRETRGARSLRKRATAFEEHMANGDLHGVIRTRGELDEVSAALRQDLGLIRRVPVRTTLVAGAPGVSLEIPFAPIPSTVTQRASRAAQLMRRPWLVLLRDIFDALASASSLGDLYEILYTPGAHASAQPHSREG